MYPVIVWSCCYMNQISDVVWNIRKYNNVDMSDDKDVKSCKHCFLRRLQSLLERSRRFLVAIAVFTLQWCDTAEMSSFLRKQKTTRCGQNEQKKEANESYRYMVEEGKLKPAFRVPKVSWLAYSTHLSTYFGFCILYSEIWFRVPT